uniref:Putative transposase n=1 Tax=Corethrella appendiculata TaxID=1370023 RepID=U5ENN7_9DIPT
MYLNIAGLTTHIDELKIILEDCKPKLVFLTETHITADIDTDELHIDGYNIINCLSHSRHTGGILIYVQQNIRCKILTNVQYNNDWFLAISVIKGDLKGNYCAIYHSPNSSDREFCDYFEENILENFIDNEKLNIILGDFNINWKCERDSQELKRITNAYALKQCIHDNTRTTKYTSTLIDMVFSNFENISAIIDPDNKISDHETIKITICDNNCDKNCDMNILKIKCWKNYSRNALKNLLRNEINNLTENNINDMAESLILIIKKCVNKLVYVKFVKVQIDRKWYSVDLKICKEKRDKSYKKAKESNEFNDWEHYKIVRNEYSNLLKRKKSDFIKNEIRDNQNDGKKLWKILKRMLKPGVNKSSNTKFENEKCDNINCDNNSCDNNNCNNNNCDNNNCDKRKTAKKFNKYFIESVKKINESIDNVDLQLPDPFSDQNQKPYLGEFILIDIEKLKNIVNNLKNTSGVDEVSAQVLKDSFDIIGEKLLHIINVSLRTGIVPTNWKTYGDSNTKSSQHTKCI